ncbi:helix-turn-helix domain-containing protein [Streptomyces sp. NPDC057757]|uniref:helix-turn-helix domain-containing protein n=1 Tax=Streptomyces sp. NPDC057757 TaxID=3346241 RepID=UPI0036C51BE7
MKWNLRMVAAQRGLWRPAELHEAFHRAGFTPSLSKVSALWRAAPVSVRLDDLDRICTVLGCTVGDLLQAGPPPPNGPPARQSRHQTPDRPTRPAPRRDAAAPRSLPPN